MKKASWGKRMARLWGLLGWLFDLAGQFRRLDHADLAQREQVLQQAAKRSLTILGVQLVCEGQPEKQRPNDKGLLVVANHVSWLDIMVVCALYPCGFIAMKEIRSWPVLGRIVANAGTVFIDRRNRKDIDPINAAIAHALHQGKNVCFYPEARTSLGNNVLPLKAALFQAAINAQATVQPLALRYYDELGRSEAVSFSGINFVISLWRIVSMEQITVRANILPPVLPDTAAERFAIKEMVEQGLREVVLRDSPNPERVLP